MVEAGALRTGPGKGPRDCHYNTHQGCAEWHIFGQLASGGCDAEITVEAAALRPLKGKPFTIGGFPSLDILWEGGISLRREDLYDDDDDDDDDDDEGRSC